MCPLTKDNDIAQSERVWLSITLNTQLLSSQTASRELGNNPAKTNETEIKKHKKIYQPKYTNILFKISFQETV